MGAGVNEMARVQPMVESDRMIRLEPITCSSRNSTISATRLFISPPFIHEIPPDLLLSVSSISLYMYTILFIDASPAS